MIQKINKKEDKDKKFVHKYPSAKAAADQYGVYKGTIGRYVKSGKLFKGIYYICPSRQD